MADQQRPKIHPTVNVEAPAPTTPLVPHGSSVSDKASPVPHRPPLGLAIPARPLVPHGSLVSDKASPVPHRPPLGLLIPAIQAKPARKRSCWCKCVCWAISLLVLILVILGIAAVVIYLVFKPKLPNYSIDSLRISDLRLNFDMSLYARFDVKVTANNPNEKIGIYYEKGGMLSVWYTKTQLCEGSLPNFYQGHENKTVLDVALTGQNQYGSALMSALQEQQQTGQIPLDLKVRAPVSIKLGRLKLRKVKVLGGCLLVVDSLSTNNMISIKASSCKFRLKL